MSSGMNGTKSRGVFSSVEEMKAANLRVGVRVDVYGGDTYDIYATNQGSSIELDNGLWAEIVVTGGVTYSELTTAQNDIVGGSIFKGSNGEYVQNGDTVPSGTTHLRVLVGGKPIIVAMSPIASGVVSNLTGTSATIGVESVTFAQWFGGLTNYQAASVADMLQGITVGGESITLSRGQVWTINGTWRHNGGTAGTIADFDVVGEFNPKDFGLVMDEVAVEDVTLQKCVDFAQDANVELVMSGTSNVDAEINIDPSKPFKAYLKIKSSGSVLNITNTPHHINQLATFANYGNEKIILNSQAVGVQKGDLVSIVSNEDFEETNRPGKKHFAAIVNSLENSNLSVVLDRPVAIDFSNGFTHTVNFYRNADLSISGELTPTELNANQAVYMRGIYGSKICTAIKGAGEHYQGKPDPISSPNNYSNGVVLHECVDNDLDNMKFSFLNYAILAHNGTSGTVNSKSIAIECRHTMNPAFGANNNKNLDCKSYRCYAGFDSHETAINTIHINCESHTDEVQCKFRGRSDYVTGNYDKLSLITDAGLQSSYSTDSKIGRSLAKYFQGSVNSGEIVTTGNSVELNSVNLGNCYIKTSSEGAICRSLAITGRSQISVFDESSISQVSIITQPEGYLYIEDLEIKGENSGVIPTDNMSTNKIGLYLPIQERFDIQRLKGVGLRSVLYFNLNGESYNGPTINALISERCGEGIRVLGSGLTYVDAFKSYTTKENFSDGASLEKLKVKKSYYDGTSESLIDYTPDAIARLIL